MSLKAKFIIGIIILVLIGGGIFWLWNKWTGKYKIGAQAIIGCQSPSQISAFMGPPGSNQATYNLFGHDVTVNEKIVPYLNEIQKEVNAANTGYSFDDIQTFNIRPKVGGSGQSLHSWGIAIDINPGRNPYQLGNWGAPQTDIPQPIIDIFKKHGFAWGGDWPGERDSMHFEWYGSELAGSFISSQTGQKILDVVALIDGNGAQAGGGNYSWNLVVTHPHEVIVKSNGFEDQKFPLDAFCWQDRTMDIALKPLPDNLPGSIGGTITLAGNRPPVIPATILLDGKAVGASNVRGDYLITGVIRGKHKVEAKVMFFPGAAIDTPDMLPGQNIRNLNFSIGT